MLDAAHQLIIDKGDASFTTQELVKQAGVALQTFYRYFASKDELLLAVIGDAMTDACRHWAAVAADLPDPLTRLRFYLASVLAGSGDPSRNEATARFIVSTRWQLHRVFPKELAAAEQPFVDLLCAEIAAARDAGLVRSTDPSGDAWLIAELMRSVYHYCAYAQPRPGIEEQLWQFCLRALGGDPSAQVSR